MSDQELVSIKSFFNHQKSKDIKERFKEMSRKIRKKHF